MEEPVVVHNTFVLERAYPKPPERVFAAFADAAKKRRWYAEGDSHEIEEFEMDFRVGGAERFTYRFTGDTPFKDITVTNEGAFQDIVPNRRVVLSSRMALGGNCISATLVTVELLPLAEGTHLVCTHYGAYFEGADGPQIRQAGWHKLFDKLAAELVNH